jgi:diguanylate cyclase (GGDEF)-like protein
MCVLRGPNHVFELANDAYYALVGKRSIIGKNVRQVMPELISQGFVDTLDTVYKTGEPFVGRALPIQFQSKNEQTPTQRFIDFIYQPIRDGNDNVNGIFVQGHDVTEAHQLARKIHYQAAHDPLTGLVNRRELARQAQALTVTEPLPPHQQKPHALLYLDLDQFKIINDRCGHAAGDALLRQVAKLLSDHVRDSDILARMGGDEFALVLKHCQARHATMQAERLRNAIQKLVFVWNGQRYGISISVGIAVFRCLDTNSFNQALSLADAACFLAKEKGRNRVQMYHTSDAELIRQQRDMDWAARLRDCLEQGRIQLYGQRIVDLRADSNSTIERWELLARLVDEQGSVVAPGTFIPAAERYGLMPTLDRHVIRLAFTALHALPVEQRERTVFFINMSGMTLSDESLPESIEQMLNALPGLDPRSVCFEITETAAMSNLAASRAAMLRLIALGFSFALDDFGSGVSSFAYLRQLPVRYIKIDGEFITHLEHDPVSRAMVEAMTKVAHTMKIETVGEFVENEDIARMLRELGIDYGQGFGLHKPEPMITP